MSVRARPTLLLHPARGSIMSCRPIEHVFFAMLEDLGIETQRPPAPPAGCDSRTLWRGLREHTRQGGLRGIWGRLGSRGEIPPTEFR